MDPLELRDTSLKQGETPTNLIQENNKMLS